MPPVARPETTCWTKMSTGSVPEVRAPDGVVLPEGLGRPRHDDAPGLEQVRVGGEVERHRGVLLHEQDADALLAGDRAHDAEDLPHDQGREAQRGLVEQQQARPDRKSTRLNSSHRTISYA